PRGSEQEPCRGQRFALCAWARSEGDPVEPDGDFSPAVAQEEVGPARAAFAVLGTTQVGPRHRATGPRTSTLSTAKGSAAASADTVPSGAHSWPSGRASAKAAWSPASTREGCSV